MMRYSSCIVYLISCLLLALPSCGDVTDAVMAGIGSPLPAEKVSFVSFGDWGDGSTRQRAVANAIGTYCWNWRCEFVVTLGDNFYQRGVEDVKDSLWKKRYRDVYGRLNLPFYASLGNHDVMGNMQAQIDYSTIDTSWHMPAEYYSFAFPKDSQTPVVEVFVINTGDFEFQGDEEAWLSDAIAGSHATWKLLAMHMPIISNAYENDNYIVNGDRLISNICGKVDLVLGGHVHIFSHLSGKNRNYDESCVLEQLVIGTGGSGTFDFDPSDPRAHASASINGFGWFQATHGELLFRMIDKDNDVFYETSWHK